MDRITPKYNLEHNETRMHKNPLPLFEAIDAAEWALCHGATYARIELANSDSILHAHLFEGHIHRFRKVKE